MSNKELELKNTHLTNIHTNLMSLLKAKSNALPKDFNQTRFAQNCMCVMQDTKDINKYSPLSIARTLLKGAFLGLDFFNKECYAIPFGAEMQFMTDYKGERKLCLKYSKHKTSQLYSKIVRRGDNLNIRVENGKQYLDFNPKPFNDAEIIGAFAVVVYADGVVEFEVMSVSEMESVKENYSKAKASKAWISSKDEMYRKTVLRRLMKSIDLDFDTTEQQEAFQKESDFSFDEEKKPEIKDPFTVVETISEADYSDAIDVKGLDYFVDCLKSCESVIDIDGVLFELDTTEIKEDIKNKVKQRAEMRKAELNAK